MRMQFLHNHTISVPIGRHPAGSFFSLIQFDCATREVTLFRNDTNRKLQKIDVVKYEQEA